MRTEQIGEKEFRVYTTEDEMVLVLNWLRERIFRSVNLLTLSLDYIRDEDLCGQIVEFVKSVTPPDPQG
jgi:hypothetical protein